MENRWILARRLTAFSRPPQAIPTSLSRARYFASKPQQKPQPNPIKVAHRPPPPQAAKPIKQTANLENPPIKSSNSPPKPSNSPPKGKKPANQPSKSSNPTPKPTESLPKSTNSTQNPVNTSTKPANTPTKPTSIPTSTSKSTQPTTKLTIPPIAAVQEPTLDSSKSTTSSKTTSPPNSDEPASQSFTNNATPEAAKEVAHPRFQHEPTWLAKLVLRSPTGLKLFYRFMALWGYMGPKQLAERRAFALYENVCAVKADDDDAFWKQDCDLPATFQSWFTITNLHVWLLTVRLRSLPSPENKYYVQFLVDHFFIDVEDRIRDVLQPPKTPVEPYTFHTPFYVNPNEYIPAKEGEPPKPRVSVPERIVTGQMKIFREQLTGLSLSFDYAMMKGDVEMAAAIWRNLLGARGAKGIAFPGSQAPAFRRSVNLVGSTVVNIAKVDFEKEELKDDGSGVHDYPPAEYEKYVKYPELMLDLVSYARRELVRLENLSDKQIMKSADFGKLKFGKVRSIKNLS